MKFKKYATIALVGVATLAIAEPQIKQVIKILGVGVAVKQFGPQINKEINKLSKHTDTPAETTRVVPIITIGVGDTSYVGAAQVTGPKWKVDKVAAVAEPSIMLFKEIKVNALIPVSSKDVIKDIKTVQGVGVTGIVDLRL